MKKSGEIENPVAGKYEIERSDGKIELRSKATGDSWSFGGAGAEARDFSVTRFERLGDGRGSLSGKLMQYSDVNGASSEVVVDESGGKWNPVRDGAAETGVDYACMDLAFEDGGESGPVFVRLTPEEKGGAE